MKTLKIILLLSLITIFPSFTQTWEFVGLDSMVIKHLFVSGDTIWAGTAHRVGNLDKSGFYKSTNAGSTWVQLDSVLGVGTIAGIYIDKEYTMNILISKGFNSYTGSGTFYKTTDGGENWQGVQCVTPSSIAWFGVSPFNKNEIYFTAGGEILELYKSSDGGETWDISGDFPVSSHGSLLTVSFDLTDSMSLYVTDDTQFNKYLFKSTNKGDSWFYVSEPPIFPTETYTDYLTPGRLYLMSFLYVSNNGGFNWFQADSGLTENSSYLSFYQDGLTTRLLYILQTDGLYVSRNDVFYWNRLDESENLPVFYGPTGFYFDKNMMNIFIEPVTKELFVGTAKGIYKTGIITHTQEEIKNPTLNFLLKQNFPNPFNPSTIISYQIPERIFIKIIVYDMLGREVITLVEEEQMAGQYEVVFESNDLPSGVYLYVLTATSENGLRIKEGKKMLMLK